jgi:tRNA A37 methylthiotransferase MiaB
VLEVLVERFDIEDRTWRGRSQREAPEVDGEILIETGSPLAVGDYIKVEITDNDGADLIGHVT